MNESFLFSILYCLSISLWKRKIFVLSIHFLYHMHNCINLLVMLSPFPAFPSPPQLKSLSSKEGCPSFWIILLALFWTFSNFAISFLIQLPVLYTAFQTRLHHKSEQEHFSIDRFIFTPFLIIPSLYFSPLSFTEFTLSLSYPQHPQGLLGRFGHHHCILKSRFFGQRASHCTTYTELHLSQLSQLKEILLEFFTICFGFPHPEQFGIIHKLCQYTGSLPIPYHLWPLLSLMYWSVLLAGGILLIELYTGGWITWVIQSWNLVWN